MLRKIVISLTFLNYALWKECDKQYFQNTHKSKYRTFGPRNEIVYMIVKWPLVSYKDSFYATFVIICDAFEWHTTNDSLEVIKELD
jgi:hypothetical protein